MFVSRHDLRGTTRLHGPSRGLVRATLLAAALATGLASLAGLPGSAPADAAEPDAARGQFVIRCRFSHSLPDDPIVHPGHPGVSHLHDFFGNTTVNADSTVGSMLAGGTTCRVPSDTAGYWSPTASLDGVPLTPKAMRIYYFGVTDDLVETLPPGLKIIGGNPDALTPAENPHVTWSCGESRAIKTPREQVPYDCTVWAPGHPFVDGVVANVEMPNCWNGIGLEPPDVVYPVDGACPAGFPRVLPRLSQRIHLGIMDPLTPAGDVALTLSSGAFHTMHADFWNTWQQPRLDQLVAECLNAHVRCGGVEPAPAPEWTTQFGTQRYDLALALAESPDGIAIAGTTTFELPGEDFHQRTDGFVRLIDPQGEELWTDQFGTVGIDRAMAVATDRTNVFVAGSTDRTLHGQESAGGVDAFVRAYDLEGNELWTVQFGSAATDEALAVAVDGSGVFVAGTTEGRLGRLGLGGVDGFISRFDRSGTEIWRRQLGTEGTDRIRSVAVDARGVNVGGTTDGVLGATSAGAIDAFVRHYSRGGRPIWTTQFGTSGSDDLRSIASRRNGIVAAGSTDGAFPDASNEGALDGFVRRLDRDGGEIWTRQFGSTEDDVVAGVGITSTGVVVAGSTTGSLPDAALLGETDAFLLKYNAKGALIWTVQFGTDDFDAAHGLAVAPSAAYVGGETHGTFEGQVYAGDRDVFITKIRFA
jgi:Domain of unknown function (DUF1996)